MDAVHFPAGDWDVADEHPLVDSSSLDHAIARLMGDRAAVGLTQSIVVVHDGRIVREAYGPGGGRERPMISWSIAKSITSALVGIAIGDGRLSIDDDNLVPEWANDARSTISLRHLLNMSSGLAWAEDYVDSGVSNVIEMLFAGQDVVPAVDEHGRLDPRLTRPVDAATYAATMPLGARPGTRYAYSSGTTNIVSRIISRSLGERPGSSEMMAKFMGDRLFSPIGMTTATAVFDHAGTFVGSSYVYATARDFARFGWLYANDGVWRGQRILPDGWVSFSATETARDPENGLGYGGHWWVFPDDPGSMCALGYEGQFTYVSPRRRLVIVRLGCTDASLNPNLQRQISDVARAFPATGW